MKINENKFAKETWLNYFNDILFEKGIITEKEKNKMSTMIRNQLSSTK